MRQPRPNFAFPHRWEEAWSIDGSIANAGMTLRDWFAGQALVGIAGSITPKQIIDLSDGVKGGNIEAKASYALADAMLKVIEPDERSRLSPGDIADHIGVTPHSNMRPFIEAAVKYARGV